MRCGKCAVCILIQTAGPKYEVFACRGVEPVNESAPVGVKPRMSFEGMAAKRRNCREAKAQGRPCFEFSVSSNQTILPSSSDIDQISPGG